MARYLLIVYVAEMLPAQIMTPRLVLRLWEVNDAPSLAIAIASSLDHLTPWMPWTVNEPLSIGERQDLIESWSEDASSGGDVVYGVFLGEVAIGGCGLHQRRGPGALEIGYWIHVEHIGNGFATELAAALTDTAFGEPSIEHVEIHHDKANLASAAIPRRLGYALVSELPDEKLAPGEIGIDCAWVMSREQWAIIGTQTPDCNEDA